jgi:hypothetical protein
MIKIFTTDDPPSFAGDNLQKQFNSWNKGFEPNTIEILNIHSNSNSYGWMMIVHYKIIEK